MYTTYSYIIQLYMYNVYPQWNLLLSEHLFTCCLEALLNLSTFSTSILFLVSNFNMVCFKIVICKGFTWFILKLTSQFYVFLQTCDNIVLLNYTIQAFLIILYVKNTFICGSIFEIYIKSNYLKPFALFFVTCLKIKDLNYYHVVIWFCVLLKPIVLNL